MPKWEFLGKLTQAIFGQSEPERRQVVPGIEHVDAVPVLQRESRPPGSPADFFPTAAGCTWDYMIDVSGDPLYLHRMVWPAGNRQVGVTTRGRFARGLHDSGRRQFQLTITVARLAEVQGPLQYPGGVELSIEQDDLGVYEDHRKVFWALTSHERFEALEVITYSPNHPGAPRMDPWGSWGVGDDGHSLRPLFFADRPGIAIGLGENPPDMLAFEGIDSTKAPQWGNNVLHFVRHVKEAESPGELSSGFEEHMWYASGKGLVELKQFVGGRETMHWVLRNFQTGG